MSEIPICPNCSSSISNIIFNKKENNSICELCGYVFENNNPIDLFQEILQTQPKQQEQEEEEIVEEEEICNGKIEDLDYKDIKEYCPNFKINLFKTRRDGKTYERTVHWRERAAAFSRKEPDIETNFPLDFKIIQLQHQVFYRTNPIYRMRTDQGLLNKKDIQQLLR